MPKKQGKHLLWRNFFQDPLLWLDNRGTKKSSRSPDFKRTTDSKTLWIHECKLPVWVHEELSRRRGFLIGNLEGVLCVRKRNRKEEEEEEEEDVSYVVLLKMCAKKKDLASGIELHDAMLRSKGSPLERNPRVASALVNMYAKCGSLPKAEDLLEELPWRDAAMWSALIAGYARAGQGHQALKCFERMQAEGIAADPIALLCILRACADAGAVDQGMEIHEEIVRRGLLKKKKKKKKRDAALGTALIDMYARWGFSERAREVLEEEGLASRDVVAWNALISGHLWRGRGREALECFERMQREKKKKIIAPNAVTLLCALKACAMARDVRKGEEVHKEIASKECGLLSSSEEEVTMLVNALVDMYGKCGRLGKAQRVLEEAGPMRNVVTWNALIGGYAEANRLGEAWECLERMREDDGLEPNAVTFICMLKACGQCGALEQGQHLHASIAASCSEALLKTNTHNNNNNNNDNNNDNNNNDNDNGNNTALGNAVVDMYARCGAVSRAREVLDRLPDRTLLSWSALIAGYARLGRAREAAGCLGAMRKQGLAPNAVTLASMLKALGGSTSTSTSASAGLQASGFVVDRRLLEKEIVLGNATVAMYARRGMLDEARSVADQLPAHDVVTWNALIAGLAEQGQGPPALACFERMRSDGIVPNATTFLSAIHACRRSGLSEPALALLSDMRNRYRLLPGTQHHACLVAALGDAGHLQMAASIISTVPDHDPALWLALLASCSRWGANAGLALLAFDRVLQMDRACAPAYVLIARILTASGLLDDGCRPSLQEERPSLQEERPEL